jgi:hypothetical protein
MPVTTGSCRRRSISRGLPGTNDLQVNLTARQPEDGPVQAIAVTEDLQDRQPDAVPVEGDRLLVARAPPHDPQRACGEVRWASVPARALCPWRQSVTPAPTAPVCGLQQCLSRQSPSRTTPPAVGQTSRLHYPLAAEADVRPKWGCINIQQPAPRGALDNRAPTRRYGRQPDVSTWLSSAPERVICAATCMTWHG